MNLVPLAPSYITPAQFAAMPNDNAKLLANYNTTQIQSLLTRASGIVNAITKRNLLAREVTEMFQGENSPSLSLGATPVIYVRQMQFITPGQNGYIVPSQRVLIDGMKGELTTYAPLELQGIGYVPNFPQIPFAVTYGAGYGYNPTTPPVWSSADAVNASGGLTPGAYVLGVTARTEWGETQPAYKSITTATGAIAVTVTPVLGALKYRVFLAPGALTTTTGALSVGAVAVPVASATGYTVGQAIALDPMTAAAEVVTITAIAGLTLTTTATANAHASGVIVSPQLALVGEIPATSFGSAPAAGTFASLTPPAGYYAENAPLADTSQIATPPEIQEATRLLSLQILYEQNNLANRGIVMTDSGRKRTGWRSTEGNAGKGTPTLWQQAEEMLSGYKLSGFFGK